MYRAAEAETDIVSWVRYKVKIYASDTICRFRLNLPTWLGPISAVILWGMGRGILSAGLVVGASCIERHKRGL